MTVSKARVLVAVTPGKSVVGHDLLIALEHHTEQPIKRGECERTTKPVTAAKLSKNVNSEDKLGHEAQHVFGEFPILFATISQQKSREH